MPGVIFQADAASCLHCKTCKYYFMTKDTTTTNKYKILCLILGGRLIHRDLR